MDSVMSYNSSEGSQIVSEAYLTSFPEASKEMISEKRKGDFIAVTSRRYDAELANLFKHHWENQDDSKFRFKNLELSKDIDTKFPNDTEALERHSAFLRSDHIRFWFANHVDYYGSFRAINVMDTGPARGEMKDCYHQECDTVYANATKKFTSLELLQKVTQTTIDLLLDVTNSKCSGHGRKIHKFRTFPPNYYFFDKVSNRTIRDTEQLESPSNAPKLNVEVPDVAYTSSSIRSSWPYIYGYMYENPYYVLAPLGYFVNVYG